MTANVEGVSLRTVGLILIILGAIGLVLGLLYMFAWRPQRRPAVLPPEEVDPAYRDPAYRDPSRTY